MIVIVIAIMIMLRPQAGGHSDGLPLGGLAGRAEPRSAAPPGGYIYIYIYIERERDVYNVIHIYTYRERERDR